MVGVVDEGGEGIISAEQIYGCAEKRAYLSKRIEQSDQRQRNAHAAVLCVLLPSVSHAISIVMPWPAQNAHLCPQSCGQCGKPDPIIPPSLLQIPLRNEPVLK